MIQLLLQTAILPFMVKDRPHLPLPQTLFAREVGRKTSDFIREAHRKISAFTAVTALLLEKAAKCNTALFYAVKFFSDRFDFDSNYELQRELVKILLNDNTVQGHFALLSQTNNFGINVWKHAILTWKVQIVDLLLPHYARLGLLTQTDSNGRNVLHLAVLLENVEIVTLLLSHCESSNLLMQTDNNGQNALHKAMLTGKLEIFTQLLPHYVRLGLLAETDKSGINALSLTIMNGSVEIVDILLPHYARLGLLTQKNNDGKDALQLAIGTGNVEIVDLLLPYFPKKYVRTVLRWAIRHGHNNMVELLPIDVGCSWLGCFR